MIGTTRCFTIAVLLVCATNLAMIIFADSANASMSGDGIKSTIAGKRIYLQTPFGGEFPLYYQRSGRVDGSGKAVGLGRFMQPNDSGRWWIQDDQLCQQWQSWYDGKRFCFTLKEGRGDTLLWTGDDGMSGKARITE